MARQLFHPDPNFTDGEVGFGSYEFKVKGGRITIDDENIAEEMINRGVFVEHEKDRGNYTTVPMTSSEPLGYLSLDDEPAEEPVRATLSAPEEKDEDS